MSNAVPEAADTDPCEPWNEQTERETSSKIRILGTPCSEVLGQPRKWQTTVFSEQKVGKHLKRENLLEIIENDLPNSDINEKNPFAEVTVFSDNCKVFTGPLKYAQSEIRIFPSETHFCILVNRCEYELPETPSTKSTGDTIISTCDLKDCAAENDGGGKTGDKENVKETASDDRKTIASEPEMKSMVASEEIKTLEKLPNGREESLVIQHAPNKNTMIIVDVNYKKVKMMSERLQKLNLKEPYDDSFCRLDSS